MCLNNLSQPLALVPSKPKECRPLSALPFTQNNPNPKFQTPNSQIPNPKFQTPPKILYFYHLITFSHGQPVIERKERNYLRCTR